MRSRLPLWLVTATTVLALLAGAGCGVRGSLDAPPSTASDTPPSPNCKPKKVPQRRSGITREIKSCQAMLTNPPLNM